MMIIACRIGVDEIEMVWMEKDDNSRDGVGV